MFGLKLPALTTQDLILIWTYPLVCFPVDYDLQHGSVCSDTCLLKININSNLFVFCF